MAIKFSQFVVQTNASALSHIVGYNGADNIQITPADFINSFVPGGPFLPLAGGTMTGDLLFGDGIVAKFGTGDDLRIQHTGNQSYIQNYTGDLQIQNQAVDKDILFRADDGTGVVTTYFYLDGSGVLTRASRNFRASDSIKLQAGSSGDLSMFHNGTDSYLENDTGDLYITQNADDKDIIFRSDNGSGGNTIYFRLDGSNERLQVDAPNGMLFSDNITAKFGTSTDLQIYHDGSNSYIKDNGTGDLRLAGNVVRIRNAADTENMISCVQDGEVSIAYNNATKLATTNTGVTVTGDLTVTGSITGSGGSFLPLAGGTMSGDLDFGDGIVAQFGGGNDLRIQHNGTGNFIDSITGNLSIRNFSNDKDIIFQSDDGSGGLATYFYLDGSLVNGSSVLGATRFPDKSKIYMGTGGDLEIFHDGANSYIQGVTGDMYIQNGANDKDIIFRSDDGAGGQTTYFFLDGSATQTTFQLDTKHNDNVKAKFGDSVDLQISHNGTDSFIINETGDFYISNQADDKDIRFTCDDSAGGTTTYFQLDGANVLNRFYKNVLFQDNVSASFGASFDLQIYHDGSNSYIKETGTGDLRIWADSPNISTASGNKIFYGNNGAAELYHTGGVKKLETTTTGIKVSGVSEFADNTAAIAGGLTTGDVYRTGDLLKIVH